MPINTLFQLIAEEDGDSLAAASRIALVPDLLAGWLSGSSRTIDGGLDDRFARRAQRALGRRLIERLGLPSRIFGELVEPGTTIGSTLPHCELGAIPVCAVAAHDTASAFAAAPLRDQRSAVLSSGTWSLLGLELDEPVLDEEAQAFNLSNERGLDGTTRLLRNVMGLWLLQESRRSLAAAGTSEWDDLLRLAEAVSDDVPLFDPDDDDLLRPGEYRRGSPPRACAPASRPRPRRASSCAASSSRWPASTGSCSSASSR